MTLNPRRRLLAACAALPLCVRAQVPAAAPRRIAFFALTNEAAYAQGLARQRAALQRAGLVEGRDYVSAAWYADFNLQRLPEVAAQVAAWWPDVVISTVPALRVLAPLAPQAGLLGMGLTDATAQELRQLHGPAARVTGVDMWLPELNAKRVEVLAEVLPAGSTVLCLQQAQGSFAVDRLEAVAQRLGLRLHMATGQSPQEIEAAFEQARRLKVQALNVLASQPLDAQRQLFIRLAAQHRLPVMYEWHDAVAEGGLMSYGLHRQEFGDQVIRLAWKLAQGVSAASLPVERPTRVILALNMKTARAIGFKFPPPVLARADEVLE